MSEERTIKIRKGASEYLLLKGGVIETKLTECKLEQALKAHMLEICGALL